MTVFKGRTTGFNPSGSNDTDPNPMGPPKTKFGGRPAVPAGPLKRFPGGASNISTSNRRNAKSKMGDDGGSGTSYTGRSPFGGK